MLPKNFPQRVHDRREEALARREKDLAIYESALKDPEVIDLPEEVALYQHKIVIAKSDIKNLSYKLGLPLIHETKHFAQDGKRNRRNK